jgi:hypothetical protein
VSTSRMCHEATGTEVTQITYRIGVPIDSVTDGKQASNGESSTFKKASTSRALGNEL